MGLIWKYRLVYLRKQVHVQKRALYTTVNLLKMFLLKWKWSSLLEDDRIYHTQGKESSCWYQHSGDGVTQSGEEPSCFASFRKTLFCVHRGKRHLAAFDLQPGNREADAPSASLSPMVSSKFLKRVGKPHLMWSVQKKSWLSWLGMACKSNKFW